MEAPNETSASANVRWRISTLNRDLCSYYQCILFKHNMCFNKLLLLPPATKLGQGYIFTGVCDSVHRGGGLLRGCLLQGVCSQGEGGLVQGVPGGDHPGTATAAGGTHPTGMHSCSSEKISANLKA